MNRSNASVQTPPAAAMPEAAAGEAAIEIIPFRPRHLTGLRLQAGVAYLQRLLDRPDYCASLNVPGLTFSGVIEGRVAGAAGILPQHDRRALAWALLEPLPRRAWPAITRRAREVLDEAHGRGYERIEALVHADDPAGMVWIRGLDFVPEAWHRRYLPGGADALLYVRFDPRVVEFVKVPNTTREFRRGASSRTLAEGLQA